MHTSIKGRSGLRSCLAFTLAAGCSLAASAAGYSSSVVASDLNNPRGLAFGPDGGLYITEAGLAAGTGPSTLVRGEPYTYTTTGSVTRYFGGAQSRVMTGLASDYGATSGDVVGPNGITFGSAGTPIIAIGGGVDPTVRATDLGPGGVNLSRLLIGSTSVDLGAWEATDNPAGGPLDSDPWHVARLPDATLVSEAGGNSLLRVGDDGTISTVASFASRALGGPFPTEPVPTGIAVGPDGAYYVGELTGFPFPVGEARIYRIEPGFAPTIFATGFTMISDLAFGADGSLYALEYDSNGLLAPGSAGALWKVGDDGSRSLVFGDGLVNPTGLAIGSDGFYVSNFGASSGDGQVLRIAAVPEPQTYALMGAGTRCGRHAEAAPAGHVRRARALTFRSVDARGRSRRTRLSEPCFQ
ncbi:MAG: ScyD/ScyE family protein, partial [Caldimonas sp.]